MHSQSSLPVKHLPCGIAVRNEWSTHQGGGYILPKTSRTGWLSQKQSKPCLHRRHQSFPQWRCPQLNSNSIDMAVCFPIFLPLPSSLSIEPPVLCARCLCLYPDSLCPCSPPWSRLCHQWALRNHHDIHLRLSQLIFAARATGISSPFLLSSTHGGRRWRFLNK